MINCQCENNFAFLFAVKSREIESDKKNGGVSKFMLMDLFGNYNSE